MIKPTIYEKRISDILKPQRKLFYPISDENDEIKEIRKKLYSKLKVKSS